MDDIPDLVTELPPDFETKTLHLATVEDTSAFGAKPEVSERIPVTVITGYLGSGKSTLLEAIGRTSNKRLAIILNEFGDTNDIEKAVTIQDPENAAVQEWLDLGNGCLCCTVKDNGVMAIENLVENSKDKIDYILLETTGVADPAPIAQMFWLDEALASSIYIDGIVTVVDAVNIEKCLDDIGGHWHRANGHVPDNDVSLPVDMTTAHLQLALADVILVNKVDKVDDSQLASVMQKVKGVNSSSPIHTTSYGDISLDLILDLHAFEAGSDKVAALIAASSSVLFHDDRILTITLHFPFFAEASGFAKVEAFLQQTLWEGHDGLAAEIHRLKGILVCGDDVRVVQGVRDTYEVIEGGKLPELIRENKIVMIGKNLNHAVLEEALKMRLAEDA